METWPQCTWFLHSLNQSTIKQNTDFWEKKANATTVIKINQKSWLQYCDSCKIWLTLALSSTNSTAWHNTINKNTNMGIHTSEDQTGLLPRMMRRNQYFNVCLYVCRSSVLWRCWLGTRKGIWPVKTEWWGAGEVICLQRGVDLHIAQLMPLPLTVSCFSKIQIGFTFPVPAHPGSPGQRAIKWACLYVCIICSGNAVHTWKKLNCCQSATLLTLSMQKSICTHYCQWSNHHWFSWGPDSPKGGVTCIR